MQDPDIPEWLIEEYTKYKLNPRRYEQLYPVAHKILKEYLAKAGSNTQGRGNEHRPNK